MASSQRKPLAHVYVYDAAGKDRQSELHPGLLKEAGSEVLVWVDVATRDSITLELAAAALEIGTRGLANLKVARTRLTIDNFGRYQHFSVLPARGPRSTQADGSMDQLDFVVGGNWLLTVRDAEIGFLDAFRDQDKAETRTGLLSGQAFAAALLDWHFEGYFREVEAVETQIEELDQRILAEPASGALLTEIAAVQRRISHLRRRLAAQRPVFHGLTRPDLAVQDGADDTNPYDRLNRRFERTIDEIERTRELVFASLDLLTSRLSQSTNELVKALTFFTVVIGTVAAIAGLFGMNFDTPLFKTGVYAFVAVIASLGLLAVTALVWAKRNKWL